DFSFKTPPGQVFLTNRASLTHEGPDADPVNNVAENVIEVTGPCAHSPSELVAWWSGEDSTSDQNSAHPATWVGTPAYEEGRVARAFNFTGANALGVSDSPEFDLSAFTIEGWIYPTAADGAVDIIVSKEAAPQIGSIQYELGIRGNGFGGGTIPYGNL